MSSYEKDGFLGELIENTMGEQALTLLEYKGRRKKVSVPAKIDGVPVEFLCRTFQGNETVEEVRIPRGVTTLGDEVFHGCTALKKVSLSKTVKEIGRAVFQLCEKLEEVEIPAPSQVNMHHLAFDEGRYPWNEEGFLIFGSVLFCYSGTSEVVRIPEGVEQVRDYAFSSGKGVTHMKELYVPFTVTEMDAGSLRSNHQLRKLVLPEGLKRIGTRAFCHMNLEEIVLPSTVEELGEHSFTSCNQLQKITFAQPSSLKVIGKNTFACPLLGEIHLPSSVERVESFAFDGCDILSQVTLSPHTMLEKNAFPCPREEEVWACLHPRVVASFEDKDQNAYYTKLFDRWAELEPDKQEEIKEGIVRYLRELDCCVGYVAPEEEEKFFLTALFREKTEEEMNLIFSWDIPLPLAQFETYLDSSVQRGNTRITAYLLQKKKELYTQEDIQSYESRKERVELGMAIPTLEELSRRWFLVRVEGGVAVTGYRGGSGREILPSFTDDGVKVVQVGIDAPTLLLEHRFSGLNYLEMGEGTGLVSDAFRKSFLEDIQLPKDLTTISNSCFHETPLSKIVIPEGVTQIEELAFARTSLEEVILPASLTSLHVDAFEQCFLLKRVVFRGSLDVLDLPQEEERETDSIFAPTGHLIYTVRHFSRCTHLEFVGQEGGENQLERLRGRGVIEKS